MTETRKGLTLFGAPWYITLTGCAIILLCMYLEVLGTDLPSMFALTLAIGIPLYEIGERIPGFNTYIGGGIILAFLGTAVLAWQNIIPTKYVEAIDIFTSDTNFINLFIIVLITGSILSLDRSILLRSFVGYIPAILGGVGVAMLLGILGGFIFGVDPGRTVTHYVLPIMGGGNGGGAVPLSQMFEGVTGRSSDEYYNFAIIILTIGNIYAIITSALLNALGKKRANLTGDGKTLIRGAEVKDALTGEELYKPNHREIGAGFFLGLSAYMFGTIMADYLFPTIFGFPIHKLAYMIFFVVILAALGVIPKEVRAGAKTFQSFFTKNFTIVIMVGVGVGLDIPEFINAITSLGNLIIPLFVVVGAIFGSAIVGYLVGFYPIDSAVTAGLCMANRGGSGDLAVLGAANRMDLMAYAQLSSRLGGAIILLVGSVLFSILL